MEVAEAKIFLASLDKIPMTRHEVAKELIDKLNATMKVLRSEPSVWYSTDDLPHEIWRDICGYEGLYQVSIYGRIKSFHKKKPRIFKDFKSRQGYIMVSLYKNGSYKTYRTHIFVGRIFISNPDNKPQINHIDGDKANNCIWNLEWTTGKENMRHASQMGLIHGNRNSTGSKNPSAKLNEEKAEKILNLYIYGDPEFGAPALAKVFNVSSSSIYNVIKGRTFKDIT